MANNHWRGMWWVVNKNGQQVIYDDNGNPVKCITMTRVRTQVGNIPTVLVKAFVNIAESEDEMRAFIAENTVKNQNSNPISD